MAPFLDKSKYLYKRFWDGQILLRASALAFDSLLGIVPSIGLVLWYLDRVGITDRGLRRVKEFILGHLEVGSGSLFLEQFEQLTSRAAGHGWGLIGIVLLIYTLWGLLSKFGDTIDFVLKTGRFETIADRTRTAIYVRRFLILLLLPIALGISIAVSQWIAHESLFRYLWGLPAIGRWLALPVPWITNIVVCFLIYYFFPRIRISPRSVLQASLLVGPAIELSRMGMAFYSRQNVTIHKIYGVLAAIPLLILWVQVAWIILLSGTLLLKPARSRKGSRRVAST